MRKVKFLQFARLLPAGLLLVLALAGCAPELVPYATSTPLPTPTQLVYRYPVPPGRYDCIASENGLRVGTGSFTLEATGQVKDEMTGASGMWTYDPSTTLLLFSSTLDITEGTFDPNSGVLALRLREGVTRTHVEGDILACVQIMK